jgi:hypothetical protein
MEDRCAPDYTKTASITAAGFQTGRNPALSLAQLAHVPSTA